MIGDHNNATQQPTLDESGRFEASADTVENAPNVNSEG